MMKESGEMSTIGVEFGFLIISETNKEANTVEECFLCGNSVVRL